MEGQEARNNSSSVRRALSILDYLSDHAEGRGLTLADLARGLDMNKSTLLRLLSPLRDYGLVDQDPETERYRLGLRTLHWAQACLASLQLRSVAVPLLQALMEASRETVHLVVWDHGEVVYVDKVESPNTIRMFSRVGVRMPAYCTAVGKAFLAHLPEAAFDEVVARGLAPRTTNTLTTPEALRQDLERIRVRGYSIDNVENEPEVRCVGAPVFDHAGRVVAAMSVSGPTSRVTLDRVEELGRLVKRTAEGVSERLGYRRENPSVPV